MFTVDFNADEATIEREGCYAGRPRSAERIKYKISGYREGIDERLESTHRLLGRVKSVAAVLPRLDRLQESIGLRWSAFGQDVRAFVVVPQEGPS